MMFINQIKIKTYETTRKVFSHRYFFDVLAIAMLIGLYYAVFARPFFNKTFFFSGDGYHLWSFKYIILLSLKKFNALPWWDPMAYNGFPLYYHFISAWFNILNPFVIFSLVLFKIINPFVSINTYYVFHITLYVIPLNIIAIYLISRELVANKVAVVLPPFIFTFSCFQILNFHDPFIVESMIAPLFYLYALIRYNNKRTGSNLLFLLFFISLTLASLNNGIVMSAFYWSSIFTILLLVFNPSLIKDTFKLIRGLIKINKGKIILVISGLLMLSGIMSSLLPLHYNKYRVIRYRGGVVNYSSSGGLSNQPIEIEKTRIWTIVSNWIPFSMIHDKLLKYGWSGHNYRYIGLFTIPLLLAALILGRKNRYVYILLLTYFLCNGFVIYTTDNLAYRILTESSDLFRNIRNMGSVFPKGGPILFLIFLSGIGLDQLLKSPRNSVARDYQSSSSFDKLFIGMLKFLLFCGVMGTIGAIVVSHPKIMPSELPLISLPSKARDFGLRHILFHGGFYLIIFSFFCWMLFLSPKESVKRFILICLFIFTFTDLVISASHYIDKKSPPIDFNSTWWPHWYFGRIPYKILSRRKMLIPYNTDLSPINAESENMFPSAYIGGAYHNPRAINSGIKEWMVLATRENRQKFLSNWNPSSLKMRKYPDFKFFSNGYYLPFDKIRDLDIDKTILDRKPLFYLHDEKLVVSQKTSPKIVKGKYKIEKFTFNKTIITTETETDSILCFLDNYDQFWSAYVDGREVKIFRANFCFKAIKLSAGKHNVSWIYNPYPIKLAYWGFYLLICVFLIYWKLVHKALSET